MHEDFLNSLVAADVRRRHFSFQPVINPKNVLRVRGDHAPNLSNARAFACINRIKNFASNTPSEPRIAPVSVKRSNLSDPEYAEFSNTDCGCHECAFNAHGVE